MSKDEKSIKELLSELVKIQIRNSLQSSSHEKSHENLIRRIEDKVWTKILSNKTKRKPVEDSDYINFLDSSLSNIVVQSRVGPESLENMNMIIDQRSKLVETQMFCFLPLFILSQNLVKHHYQSSSGSYILQMMYILIGSLDCYSLDFWQNKSLVRAYQSDFTWRLNSIMQGNLSDSLMKVSRENMELNFDFKIYFSTFSSLLFKSNAFNKTHRDFWMDVISDFALGIVTFRSLTSDMYLNEESWFNNELTKLTMNLEEVEISRETDKIAEIAFGNESFNFTDDNITKGTGSKNSLNPKRTISINQNPMAPKTNRTSLLASFIGNSDDELDELEELEFHQEGKFSEEEMEARVEVLEDLEAEEELEIIDNKQNQIRNQNQVLGKSQHSGLLISTERSRDTKVMDSKVLNMSSFNYFDGLSKLIKEKKEDTEDENYRICNLSKVKLPTLLRRVSGRRQVQYNNNYLGFSWDQQYLSLNKTNKIFNESILNVLTTERIKNCTIVSPNHKIGSRDGHVWVKLDSVMKLFQGLDSEEFSLYPRHHRVREERRAELLGCYTIFINDYNIYLELVEEFGELSPWMNYYFQGDKFIYTGAGTNLKKNGILDPKNGFRNNINDRDKQIFLSQDLVSMICLFGTKIHYLRSLAELLILLGDKMNSELKSGSINKNEYSTYNQVIREESVVSIKILGKAILELLHMYLRDIELCFSRINSGDGQVSHVSSLKTSSYLNLIVLLAEFSPAFEMLVRIFKLRTSSGQTEIRTWSIPHGYFLLSYIYTYLWQFQINPSSIISNNHYPNTTSQKNINNRIDEGVYSSGHILSVIYKSLQRSIFRDKLDSITSSSQGNHLELELKTNLALHRSVLRSIVPVLLRILMIKSICLNEIVQDDENMVLAKTNQFQKQDLSMFFTDTNPFIQDFEFNHVNDSFLDSESENYDHGHNLELTRVSVPVKNLKGVETVIKFNQTTIMEYLRRNQLNFDKVYEIYFQSLDRAFEQMNRLEFNVNDYIYLAFEIGGLLSDKSWQGRNCSTGISVLGEFESLKELIQNKIKNKKFVLPSGYGLVRSEERGVGNLNWRENCHTTYTKQLNNYISVNGDLRYENLLRLVFGLDLDFNHYFGKQINIQETSSTFVIQKIGKEQGEEDLLKLFQMMVLLETISRIFIKLKDFVGRLVLYIWCRKYTTDYNLYIKFSQGYLYDSFSDELQKLIWEIERSISKVYGTIQVIKEYLVMLFKRFDPKTLIRNGNYQGKVRYDDKWKVVQKYYYGKLFNNLSLGEKGFLYFITCLVCQICLVLSDLISKTDSFRDLPKRPSSFSLSRSEDQDLNISQRNIILEFVDNWKSNNLKEKVSQYFQIYESLKIYISENKNIFSAENSHILYYINSQI
ncbi:uncharacterized protein ELE39_001407 [Cryptosporidium sp. chipmunk genotype I]|uniref:uncharacterized protein n=1 Tax=Cryptosporidium sp. chipmunk genotype I TaxID=1280935 RepID=UPI00351A8AC8|nr:hypothetical protein ELE39_001407 [Cryptosporidium sp. chipmunk genotype I]